MNTKNIFKTFILSTFVLFTCTNAWSKDPEQSYLKPQFQIQTSVRDAPVAQKRVTADQHLQSVCAFVLAKPDTRRAKWSANGASAIDSAKKCQAAMNDPHLSKGVRSRYQAALDNYKGLNKATGKTIVSEKSFAKISHSK